MDITIVLVNYKCDKVKLQSCLNSIKIQADVLLVDHSHDFNFDGIDKPENLNIIILKNINHGNGAGINFGIKNSKTRYVLYLDIDTILPSNFFKVLNSAFEKISNFANHTLDFFSDHPSIELELRTKSIVTSPLMKREPVRNCIVAFSLSPKKIANILDKKAPSISRRINALKQLAKAGWSVGLRFDPLIYCADWETMYSELIAEIMHDLNPRSLHSVSYGPLRFPKDMYKKIFTLHPNEKLFSFPMKEKAGIISYGTEIEDLMSKFIKNELNKYTSQNKIFRCAV